MRVVSSCACYLIQDQWQLHMIFVCIPAGLPGCSWTRVSGSDPPAGAWPRGYRCRSCCGCTVRCVLPALTLFEISQVSLKQNRHRNKIIVVLRNYTSGLEISESRVKIILISCRNKRFKSMLQVLCRPEMFHNWILRIETKVFCVPDPVALLTMDFENLLAEEEEGEEGEEELTILDSDHVCRSFFFMQSVLLEEINVIVSCILQCLFVLVAVSYLFT